MSLIKKWRKWRGFEEAREIEHREPVHEYEILHLNGKTTNATGNRKRRDEGFLLILQKNNEIWARATFDKHMDYTGGPAFSRRGYDIVKELEGIQEVKKEQIGEEVITLTYNEVTRSLENVHRKFIPK